MGFLEQGWKQRVPDRDTVKYAAASRLIRAGRLLESHLRDVSVSYGLAVRGDYEVLAALRRDPSEGLTAGALAARSMLTSAGMTGRLDRLEAQGLVKRSQHPADRRSVVISITRSGQSLADRVLEASIAAVQEMLPEGVSFDWRRLSEDLSDLLATLERVEGIRWPSQVP